MVYISKQFSHGKVEHSLVEMLVYHKLVILLAKSGHITCTQRGENLYIKGTSFTIKKRTFGYGQTNIRLQLNYIS